MNRTSLSLFSTVLVTAAFAQERGGTEGTTPDPQIPAERQSQPKAPKLKISGLIDLYGGSTFPYNGYGKTRAFRQFDIRSEEIRLATAQISLAYDDPNSGFGVTIKPFVGANADILYGLDSDRLEFSKYLAEAYGTYAPKAGKLVIDLGKFYSWIGYESLESPFSDLYSRGILFTNAQPNYHTGLRAAYQFTPQVGASVYVTQGWNQVARKTSGLSFGGQVRYAPNDRDFFALGVITGREGSRETNNTGGYGGIAFANPGSADVTLFDAIATRKLNTRTKIAFNANYATVGDPDGGAFSDGQFYGFSGIVRYDLSSRIALSGRLENLFDTDGNRFGTSATLSSVTLGLDYLLTPRSALRFEVRGDWANASLFGSANGPTRQQNTMAVAANYRF